MPRLLDLVCNHFCQHRESALPLRQGLSIDLVAQRSINGQNLSQGRMVLRQC